MTANEQTTQNASVMVRQNSTVSLASSTSTSSNRSLISQTPVPLTPNGHPIDPMSRKYPIPDGEINVAEAIKRPPGRWTIQGTYNYGQQRPLRLVHIKSAAEKAAELSAAKAKMMKLSLELNSNKK